MKNLIHYNNNWYDNLINLTTINNNNFALNISITKLSLFLSRLFHGLKIVLFSPCVIHENGFLLEEFGFLFIVDTREKKKNKNRGYSEILKVSHRFSILRENVLGGSRKKKNLVGESQWYVFLFKRRFILKRCFLPRCFYFSSRWRERTGDKRLKERHSR